VGINWAIVVAGAIVGFTVGLTGMGGGALMTPILLIFFNITPTAAVTSDLIAAVFMKPVGAGVHVRRRTVRWELVKWLCIGSVPAAFLAVFTMYYAFGDSARLQDATKLFLGATLTLAAGAMIFKAWLQGRRAAEARARGEVPSKGGGHINVRIGLTVLVGVLGGVLVGLTSVGSGSIIIICLMLIYPELRGAELVGTDLAQAIPLVFAAALAHILVGNLEWGLTGALLIGSVPACYLGARVSVRAKDGVIRPALVFVLLASAMKLLDVDTITLAWGMLAFALVAFPIWGAVDAAAHPEPLWDAITQPRRFWIRFMAIGSLFLVGFFGAIFYFWKIRPRLSEATEAAATATAASALVAEPVVTT